MNVKLIALACGITLSGFAVADTYFFGIGINVYQKPVTSGGKPMVDRKGRVINLNLQGAVNDVNFYARYFRQKGVKKWKVLPNREATSDSFKKSMQGFIGQLKPGDTFVFAFSGHGGQMSDSTEPDGKAETIVLSDMSQVPDNTFRDVAEALSKAGIHTTFIFDCCYAGGLSKEDPPFPSYRTKSATGRMGARARVIKEKKASDYKAPGYGAKVKGSKVFLMASQENVLSLDVTTEAKKGQGLFTYCLIKSLEARPSLTLSQAHGKVNEMLMGFKVQQRSVLDISANPERGKGTLTSR